MFVVTFVSISAFGVAVALAGRALGARPLAILAGALPMILLVLPALSPRASLPAQTLFLCTVLAGWWWSWRAASRPGWVNALGLATVGLVASTLGNWIHLSWAAFAAVTALIWAVMWLLTPGLLLVRRLAAAVAGTIGLGLGVVLGPYGVAGTIERAHVVSEASTGFIIEWMNPFTPGLILRWGTVAVVALLVAAASLIGVIRQLRAGKWADPRVRLRVGLAVGGVVAALAGLTAVRFTAMALLTLAPLAPLLVPRIARTVRGAALRGPAIIRSRAVEWTSESFWRPVAVALVVVLAPFTLLAAWPHSQPPGMAAIAQIPSGCRVFTSYEQSAAIILLRPDVTIWVDSRSDYYGRERLAEAGTLFFAPSTPDGRTAPDGAQCALFPTAAVDPTYAPVVRRLDTDPAWTRTTTTPEATLWVRATMPSVQPEKTS
jgi:hypothetical protein